MVQAYDEGILCLCRDATGQYYSRYCSLETWWPKANAKSAYIKRLETALRELCDFSLSEHGQISENAAKKWVQAKRKARKALEQKP